MRRMFTATRDVVLPTTVTGSWPRPRWYERNLHGEPLSESMTDSAYREQLLDALAVVISDQERAGLDILTNGDYHLDADFGPLMVLLPCGARRRPVAGRAGDDRPALLRPSWNLSAGDHDDVALPARRRQDR